MAEICQLGIIFVSGEQSGIKQKIDRQREHQANERTFLAWLRTSVAMIGFGFAIARFGLFLHQLKLTIAGKDFVSRSFVSSETLGISLAIAGIVLIALAAWRYNRVFWQIERSDYQPNRLIVWFTAATVMILGVLSFPLILWRQPASPNPPSPKRSGGIERQISHHRLPPKN